MCWFQNFAFLFHASLACVFSLSISDINVARRSLRNASAGIPAAILALELRRCAFLRLTNRMPLANDFFENSAEDFAAGRFGNFIDELDCPHFLVGRHARGDETHESAASR